MHAEMAELYPICRSITGDGVRQSLTVVARTLDVQQHEVPSGTAVFDWQVPDDWNIRDAYIKDPDGRRIADFGVCNLHVLQYSTPVHESMSLEQLRPHIHTAAQTPDWVPYRTSYYKRQWGFCMAHRQFEALADGEYEVFIDATIGPGHLTYGEVVLPGGRTDEVLLSTHICHPSMCNDNLSGVVLCAALGRLLQGIE